MQAVLTAAQTMTARAARVEAARRAANALRPDAFMWALALMNFTFIWRVQDMFPVLAKGKISLLAELTAVALFAMDSHPRRKIKEVLQQPILRMIAGLAIIMFLGLPFSIWRGK